MRNFYACLAVELTDPKWLNVTKLEQSHYNQCFYMFAELKLFSLPETGGFIKVQIHTTALRTGCSPMVTGTVIIPSYQTSTDLQEPINSQDYP